MYREYPGRRHSLEAAFEKKAEMWLRVNIFVNMYKSFCKTGMETIKIKLNISNENGCMGPTWPLLLMNGSHGMRHTGFPQVDGGQRNPRDRGVTIGV